MSDEMAVIDKVGSEDVKFSSVEPSEVGEVPEEAPEEQQPNEVSDQQSETIATTPKESPVKTEPPFQTEPPEFKDHLETPEEYLAKMETDQPNDEANIKTELEVEESSEKEVKDILEDNKTEEVKRGIKRKASIAFSDIGEDGEDMKPLIGFDQVEPIKIEGYMKILERLEEEVISASKNFVPVRHVMGTPGAPLSASKRARTDTDGSRPSSGMSSRSDDAGTDVSAGSSPANRRRATTEMSSPLLRVPLERGWKRELVYRAALDSHSRRNADIYYYTPQGKKLRSSREVAEHLSGTGLSLENFSFFKEPLGVDDPEKEIIREAKIIRRVESPVPLPAPVAVVEGKRTPKPKAPKGASPEPTPKSPPAKIKVKSVGSRLSGSGPVPSPATKQQKKPQTPVVSTADNNNSAAWKKPRPPAHPTALQGGQGLQGGQVLQGGQCGTTTQPPQPPPPLQSRPALLQSSPDEQPTRQLVQPCSMSCGRGTVPSLSCAACLCLYHPVCAGYLHNPPPSPFYCKNCRKASSPPLEPPPLIHKSGVSTSSAGVTAPLPRRVPATTPTQMPSAMAAPMPVPAKVPKQDKRVLLRMKVAGSGAEGERVWSVTGPPRATPNLPQSIVMLNGRRFIVVPRAMVQPAQAQQHSITTKDCD